MIQTEIFDTWEDGTKLIRTWSDQGYFIRQDGTGILYEEAIDPETMNRTYTETDQPISQGTEELEEIEE